MTAQPPLASQNPATAQQESTQQQAPTTPPVDKRSRALAELGLDENTVQAMKQRFGRLEVVFIGGKPYMYRPLFRQELKAIRKGLQGADDLAQEEKIVSLCLVAPKLDAVNFGSTSAGLITTLAALILAISEFDMDEQPIKL